MNFFLDKDTPAYKQWQKIGLRHHHGIALPLFSLRTQKSCGIGEFLDLIPLIQWCQSIGFDTIQLLPLNDSGHDTSPYSAHTAMGLNPIFLSLEGLPYLKQYESLQTKMHKIKQVNGEKRVLYHSLLDKKLEFLHAYFDTCYEHIKGWPSFEQFIHEQKSWLHDYALYKVLKEKNGQKAWWDWDIKDPTQDVLIKAKHEHENEMLFHIFCQFLCFDQWQKVKEAADTAGIFLKGDVPILINRDSVDVWLNRDIFLLDFSAGAPADMYSDEGQNWGFPIYNWQALEPRGYDWWIQRLKLCEKLYHIFRLDHIVGFYKIWAVPEKKSAKEGFFMPHDPNLWLTQGEKILRVLLQNTSLLPIGEDLGAVPPEVRMSLLGLGIAGTKVLRWERKWQEDSSFIDPKSFHPLSMTTLSTHDSETVSEWWLKHPDESKRYAKERRLCYAPTLSKETRYEILKECHTSSSFFHINLLQEYLALFDELSWSAPEDDRINYPGQVRDENWTYRFKPTLEEIIRHEAFSARMKEFAS
jgi:4-alpha-glucanotransferase